LAKNNKRADFSTLTTDIALGEQICKL